MGTIKVKRGEKSRLPQSASLGELLYCTDTNELYVGRGSSIRLLCLDGFELNRLISSLESSITNINKLLVNNYICPDKFEGTDFDKLQQSIDLAVKSKTPIHINRIYDITGEGSLVIRKTDRSILTIYGGVIIKNDEGSVFTSDTTDVGDIHLRSIGFQSDSRDKEVSIIDADNLIRFLIEGCWLIKFKFFKQKNPSRYLQSVRLENNTVTGSRIPIDFYRAYDLSIENNTIEHGIGAVRGNTDADPCCNTVRIERNVIEGNTEEKAIILGNSFGLDISRNYFESNLSGDIYLIPDGSRFYNGLVIVGNTFQDVSTEAAIHIKNLSVGVLSAGNTVSNKPLYKHYGNSGGAGGQLVSVGDQSLVNLFTEDTDLRYTIRLGNIYREPFTSNTGIKKLVRVTEESGIIGAGKTLSGEVTLTDDEISSLGGSIDNCVYSLYGASSGGGEVQVIDKGVSSNNIKFTITNLAQTSVSFLQVKAIILKAI